MAQEIKQTAQTGHEFTSQKGPSTQLLRFVAPKTIPTKAFGIRNLIGYLDPLGLLLGPGMHDMFGPSRGAP